jgi:rod shape-determining protein MreC
MAPDQVALKGKKYRQFLYGFLLLLCLVLTVDRLYKGAIDHPIRQNLSAALLWPLQPLHYVYNGVIDLYNEAQFIWSVHQNNRRLKVDADQLIHFQRLNESLVVENKILKKQLNYHIPNFDTVVTGRLVGQGIQPLKTSVMMLAGSRHGVRSGLPVVSQDTLVGLVTEVFQGQSHVALVEDFGVHVPIFVVHPHRGLIKGIVSGRGLHQSPTLRYVEDLTPGLSVMTSHEGGVYPKGLYLGTVDYDKSSDHYILKRSLPSNRMIYGKVLALKSDDAQITR